MTPDHYATLGVPATAKTAEIRAAYLALMREYHPDRNRDPAAVERAKAVIAAFKVLGDFDRRNQYDWDRRREREAADAAAAAAAKRPRRIRAGAFAAGAIGLAAVATWALMPAPRPKPVITEPKVAEAREVPVVRAKPRREVTRAAVAAPAKVSLSSRSISINPRPPLVMALSAVISNVKIRPPVEAQATCVAGTKGAEPEGLATGDGRHTTSPGLQVTKALPALNLEVIFSTEARKP